MSGSEAAISPAARHRHLPLVGLMRGTVALPGDDGWDEARSAFNLHTDRFAYSTHIEIGNHD